jgi:hypothetical protein
MATKTVIVNGKSFEIVDGRGVGDKQEYTGEIKHAWYDLTKQGVTAKKAFELVMGAYGLQVNKSMKEYPGSIGHSWKQWCLLNPKVETKAAKKS